MYVEAGLIKNHSVIIVIYAKLIRKNGLIDLFVAYTDDIIEICKKLGTIII